MKKLFKLGCVVLMLGALSVPVWGLDANFMNSDNALILAGRGHGPGDGTGNGGSGPKDGTGNGSGWGDCPNLKTDVHHEVMILAGRGKGGNGSGSGTGNGSRGSGSRGNGGVCPYGLN